MKLIGDKLMDVCGRCGKVVRLNKPLIGSLHVCLSDEDYDNLHPQAKVTLSEYVEMRRKELSAS